MVLDIVKILYKTILFTTFWFKEDIIKNYNSK